MVALEARERPSRSSHVPISKGRKQSTTFSLIRAKQRALHLVRFTCPYPPPQGSRGDKGGNDSSYRSSAVESPKMPIRRIPAIGDGMGWGRGNSSGPTAQCWSLAGASVAFHALSHQLIGGFLFLAPDRKLELHAQAERAQVRAKRRTVVVGAARTVYRAARRPSLLIIDMGELSSVRAESEETQPGQPASARGALPGSEDRCLAWQAGQQTTTVKARCRPQRTRLAATCQDGRAALCPPPPRPPVPGFPPLPFPFGNATPPPSLESHPLLDRLLGLAWPLGGGRQDTLSIHARSLALASGTTKAQSGHLTFVPNSSGDLSKFPILRV
ncbi:hypothetical protein JX265_007532 [Neoarthrinium moseri]|uniref:Uncharacterized protein n=1 Tax=Neoarthrinium moseri TaxID=1658444 RepID=A0A9P9WJM7_9PEZI|nr:hypothetical protein JX265_007532 [Neoarthrinium moseri]